MVEYKQRCSGRDKRINDTFFALSDPTRRDLLARIANRPDVNVGQLAENFEISLNAVSKHLKILEQAKLVKRKRHGREFRFSLSEPALAEAQQWISQVRQFWTKRLDAIESMLKRKKSNEK